MIINESLELKNNIEKNIIKLLEEEKVAFDIGSYRSAPPGLRIWGGPTVESEDITILLPWLDWAYDKTLKKLNTQLIWMEEKLPRVLISDKLSESAIDIFKKQNIDTDYRAWN